METTELTLQEQLDKLALKILNDPDIAKSQNQRWIVFHLKKLKEFLAAPEPSRTLSPGKPFPKSMTRGGKSKQ